MTDPVKPLALVTGVGPGTGAATVRRLSQGGYQVAMIARNADRLAELADAIPGTSAHPCDVTDRDVLARVLEEVGHPQLVVHNAVGGAFGTFQNIKADTLSRNFEINTMALFHLAQLTAPAMIEAGKGAIIVTGNGASQRGKAAFAGFAPTKAAQRILAESLARDLGPKGVHVAYLVIDAAIDVPWQRELQPDRPDDLFISPESIADEIFHLAHQPKDAWSFLAEVRPYHEVW
ncbi:SDR family NAD(P)-dependent oxidoreductase [Novosphingobium tardum]|uniref:SDR family NAD(P)-dependent oxidoreductase n=1 Tax=Novosphingobium tardum TaxID=1538021 RepID=A0ABV8RS00_9SPHN